jgi:UDP-3-O-[3-hydroxymyristoyl] glucosamine N-acyltransferase
VVVNQVLLVTLQLVDNVIVAAKSGVTKKFKDNSLVAGFPATDINKWKKHNY